MTSLNRCPWSAEHELLSRYHDEEWGVPVHDDKVHFEFLILEGVQAGLSWLTVLKKREAYREAYRGFDPGIVSDFADKDKERLLSNPNLIRNSRKIEASIQNARAFLRVQEYYGSFDSYIWQFVDGKPIINSFKTPDEVPAKTELSESLSKDLKDRGFSFVGPTIIYAHMQAIGMVNDHLTSCFRYR